MLKQRDLVINFNNIKDKEIVNNINRVLRKTRFCKIEFRLKMQIIIISSYSKMSFEPRLGNKLNSIW